jgi:hypothetical protein
LSPLGTFSLRGIPSEENVNAVRIMSKAWATKHNVLKPQDFAAKEETYASRNAMGSGPYLLVSYEAGVKTAMKDARRATPTRRMNQPFLDGRFRLEPAALSRLACARPRRNSASMQPTAGVTDAWSVGNRGSISPARGRRLA